jgi:hypothetical protein
MIEDVYNFEASSYFSFCSAGFDAVGLIVDLEIDTGKKVLFSAGYESV